MIYVVNKRAHTPTAQDVYIGRPSPLGNPFPMPRYTRNECIRLYRDWLENQAEGSEAKGELGRISEMAREGDVYLVCWCAPLACHGNIIKDLLEERAE